MYNQTAPSGHLKVSYIVYYQTDGIAMGFPLGGLFADAFMTSVEEHVLDNPCPANHYYIASTWISRRCSKSGKPVQLEREPNSSPDASSIEEASGLEFTTELSN